MAGLITCPHCAVQYDRPARDPSEGDHVWTCPACGEWHTQSPPPPPSTLKYEVTDGDSDELVGIFDTQAEALREARKLDAYYVWSGTMEPAEDGVLEFVAKRRVDYASKSRAR